MEHTLGKKKKPKSPVSHIITCRWSQAVHFWESVKESKLQGACVRGKLPLGTKMED